jgi:hypothetical protein
MAYFAMAPNHATKVRINVSRARRPRAPMAAIKQQTAAINVQRMPTAPMGSTAMAAKSA